MRFAAENVLDALAPTNFPLTEPGGAEGRARHRRAQLRARRAQLRARHGAAAAHPVDGRPLGVHGRRGPRGHARRGRAPHASCSSCIQYEPQTPKVRETPLLVVPPMINKYYVADLAPGRSMVEHFVGAGQQVFAISWRNPDERHADWGARRPTPARCIEALDAVRGDHAARRSPRARPVRGRDRALDCVVAHLAARGRARPDRRPDARRLRARQRATPGTAERAHGPRRRPRSRSPSRPRKRLPRRPRARRRVRVAAAERPDLELLGQQLPAGQGPAGLRHPLLERRHDQHARRRCTATSCELALDNALVRPGGATVLGHADRPVADHRRRLLVAGIADHITPWQSGYRTTQLLGSEPRFVLSTSGHIAAHGQPAGQREGELPGQRRATRRRRGVAARARPQRKGTWWDDWAAWLGERSGAERARPQALGGEGHKPLEPAPGTYVRAVA